MTSPLSPDLLSFRKHSREDIHLRVSWLCNPEVIRFLGSHWCDGTTLEKEKAWFDRTEWATDRNFFTILYQRTPIGVVGFSNQDEHGCADFFIMIGEDEYRGRGLGRAIVKRMLRHGFEKLGIRKIKLAVFPENIAACKLYESVGFQREWILKQEEMLLGEYRDIFLYALIRDQS